MLQLTLPYRGSRSSLLLLQLVHALSLTSQPTTLYMSLSNNNTRLMTM